LKELVDQALRAVVHEIGRLDLAPVDRHQPATDHRVPVEALHAGVGQRFHERLLHPHRIEAELAIDPGLLIGAGKIEE